MYNLLSVQYGYLYTSRLFMLHHILSIRIAFVALLFAAAPVFVCAQAPSSCTQALFFYEQKQYSQALTLYDQCLMDHPNDGVMYYNRGKTWYELGHIDKALFDFEAATKLSPAFVQSYYALSEHYLTKRDEANALKWMNLLLTRYPDLANAYNLRGWIYFNFKKNQLAFNDFDHAIMLDSLNASAYNNRGSARYQLQDIESASTSDLLLAKADLLRALQIDAHLANLHRNLGFIEFLLGHFSSADSLLNLAEGKNPGDAMVYYYHGLLYAKTERLDMAINEMNRAIKQYPNLAIAWLEKGRLQYQKRQYSASITSLSTGLEQDANLTPAFHYELAKAYASQFERELMLEHLKQAEKLGYFSRLANKQAFFKEPIFQSYLKWGPYKSFTKDLRGI